MGPASCAATGLADIALLQVTPSGADLFATIPALSLIQSVQQARYDRGPLCMLVPNKVDRRTGSGQEIETALGQFELPATGQMSLIRSLLVRRVLSGGAENSASISYSRGCSYYRCYLLHL